MPSNKTMRTRRCCSVLTVILTALTAPLINGFSVSKKSIPEYSTVDGNDAQYEETLLSNVVAEATVQETELAPLESTLLPRKQPQYVALSTSNIVKIQVGDVSHARKAAKKKRRARSPLLVPCSVLEIRRPHAVASNIVYLLKKFGDSSRRNQTITVSFLCQMFRRHLKYSFTKQAKWLGYDTPHQLLEELFTDHVSGIQYQSDNETLVAPWNRVMAHRTLSKYGVLEFQDDTAGALLHTGRIRTRAPLESESEPTQYFAFQDLSAALRLLPEDDGTIVSNSEVYATVYDFDVQGDAGAPLLTMSLSPRTPVGPSQQQQSSWKNPFRHQIRDLGVTDKLQGTVVALRNGYALVDCKVGNNARSVWGRLRFRDAFLKDDSDKEHTTTRDRQPQQPVPEFDFRDITYSEEEEEAEQDAESVEISGLFKTIQSEDTSDLETLSASDFDEQIASEEDSKGKIRLGHKMKFLALGDELDVYVKSVSTQSNTFTLTMDPSIVGKTAKIVKRETHADKKLSRLLDQVGGKKKLESIQGLECDGFVKATSNTGDWVYIQPMQNKDVNLPVGISASTLELEKGDLVRIRLAGVDEDRGQLAIDILAKLEK